MTAIRSATPKISDTLLPNWYGLSPSCARSMCGSARILCSCGSSLRRSTRKRNCRLYQSVGCCFEDRDYAGVPIDFSVINPALYDPFELEDLIPVNEPGVTRIDHA